MGKPDLQEILNNKQISELITHKVLVLEERKIPEGIYLIGEAQFKAEDKTKQSKLSHNSQISYSLITMVGFDELPEQVKKRGSEPKIVNYDENRFFWH